MSRHFLVNVSCSSHAVEWIRDEHELRAFAEQLAKDRHTSVSYGEGIPDPLEVEGERRPPRKVVHLGQCFPEGMGAGETVAAPIVPRQEPRAPQATLTQGPRPALRVGLVPAVVPIVPGTDLPPESIMDLMERLSLVD